jgi:hypothetical protein
MAMDMKVWGDYMAKASRQWIDYEIDESHGITDDADRLEYTDYTLILGEGNWEEGKRIFAEFRLGKIKEYSHTESRVGIITLDKKGKHTFSVYHLRIGF